MRHDATTLNHTLIVQNTDNNNIGHDVAGVVNASYSLIGFGGNFLGPLADNGGPTLTHALLPLSPAINAGDPAFAGLPAYDQRGFPFVRVSGGRIDIGAIERQPMPGDFDHDLDVDHDDLAVWEANYAVDRNWSGIDFLAWQVTYQPAAPALTIVSEAASDAPTQVRIEPRLVDLAVTLEHNWGAAITFSGHTGGQVKLSTEVDFQPTEHKPPAVPSLLPHFVSNDFSSDFSDDEFSTNEVNESLETQAFDEIFALL